jgi:hypothetical protein
MMLQASDPGPTDTHGWNDLGSLMRRLPAHVFDREPSGSPAGRS